MSFSDLWTLENKFIASDTTSSKPSYLSFSLGVETDDESKSWMVLLSFVVQLASQFGWLDSDCFDLFFSKPKCEYGNSIFIEDIRCLQILICS